VCCARVGNRICRNLEMEVGHDSRGSWRRAFRARASICARGPLGAWLTRSVRPLHTEPAGRDMTTANKITILRILLVPLFISQVLYYVETGNELYRLFAIFCFAIAALSDGIDGYIARRYNQRSEL